MVALSTGTFAGEASFVSKTAAPRSATIRAMSPLTAVRWDTSKLRALLEHPDQAALKVSHCVLCSAVCIAAPKAVHSYIPLSLLSI
jgi:hypothetical protein